MISKTHISAQKPHGRQLNAKVCGCESAIFRLLSFSLATMFNNDISKTVQVVTVILSHNWFLSQRGALRPLSVFIATNSPWSIKLFLALPGCCPLRRTPFSIVLQWHRSVGVNPYSHTRHTTVMTKTWPQSCDNKPRYRDLEQRHGHLKGTFFICSNVLYACAEVVSFPNQRPQSLVWERDWCTREIVVSCPDPPHSACSLVPRPCAFVASSTKLAQRRGPAWARSSRDFCHSCIFTSPDNDVCRVAYIHHVHVQGSSSQARTIDYSRKL